MRWMRYGGRDGAYGSCISMKRQVWRFDGDDFFVVGHAGMGADFCRGDGLVSGIVGVIVTRLIILQLQQKTKTAPSPLYSLISGSLVL